MIYFMRGCLGWNIIWKNQNKFNLFFDKNNSNKAGGISYLHFIPNKIKIKPRHSKEGRNFFMDYKIVVADQNTFPHNLLKMKCVSPISSKKHMAYTFYGNNFFLVITFQYYFNSNAYIGTTIYQLRTDIKNIRFCWTFYILVWI